MDPSCILMCSNIPRGIPEDVLIELFCVAGPIDDVSLSKSGRSCFIIYEFPEAVLTAKEIFKDVQIYGRSIEMLDQNDIKKMHEDQEKESLAIELEKAAYAEVSNQYPFYNAESMTPTHRNAARNRPGPGSYPSPNFFMPPPMHFTPPPNPFAPPMNFTPPNFNGPPGPPNFNGPPPGPSNHSFGDNYDPTVPNRRWGSAPDVGPPQQFNPAELDSFKSPYSQPVSRKGYEQSRRDYYNDDASNSNYSRNRSYNSNSSPDLSKESPGHKKFKNDDYAENTYDTPKKSYRENDRYNRDSKYNSGSGSSDHSNRYKSRDHDRSPYSRNNHQRSEQRDYRRSNNYHGKESRNYRR